MMKRYMAAVGVLATASAMLVPASAAHAATATISIQLQNGQRVALDPTSAKVKVTWTADDCEYGCVLYKRGELRSNEEELVLDTQTFPAGEARSFTVQDHLDTAVALPYRWHYELLRRTSPTGPEGDVLAYAYPDIVFSSEDAFQFSGSWTKDLDLTATETMIQRSTGPTAAAVLPPSGSARQVAILGTRGPRGGTLGISVGGQLTEVDMHAPTRRTRRAVAVVDVPADSILQLSNMSPAGEPSEIAIDGIISSTLVNEASRAATPRLKAAAPQSLPPRADETVTVTVRKNQRLAKEPQTFKADVTALVHGCPDGCSLVLDENGKQTVLLTRTFPDSPTLQALHVVIDVPDYGYILVLKNGQFWNESSPVSADQLPLSGWTFSSGWSLRSDASAVGGTVERSDGKGTGATLRVPGTFEGRSVGIVARKSPRGGVLGVYVNGVRQQTVDLRSATVNPRRVVTTLQLPIRGRVTVADVTPAGRHADQVDLSGLTMIDLPEDWY
jgi:hypothetical protein